MSYPMFEAVAQAIRTLRDEELREIALCAMNNLSHSDRVRVVLRSFTAAERGALAENLREMEGRLNDRSDDA